MIFSGKNNMIPNNRFHRIKDCFDGRIPILSMVYQPPYTTLIATLGSGKNGEFRCEQYFWGHPDDNKP